MDVQQINGPSRAVGRRTVLGLAAAAAALPLMTGGSEAAGTRTVFENVKALTFDVQGTLLDYYRPFIRVGMAVEARKRLGLDWPGMLRDWNGAAASVIQAINAGAHPWIPADRLFRVALDNLLANRGLSDRFDDVDRQQLMSIWDLMVPWPDSADGIGRLKRRFTVATLSNAGMASVIALAKGGGLPFDAVLTGELVHAYKPSPTVYQAASTYLGFPPNEIMMVAAHKIDLKAAKASGLRTAYIPRPLELGPNTNVDRSKEPFIDIVADDLIHLSEQLGQA